MSPNTGATNGAAATQPLPPSLPPAATPATAPSAATPATTTVLPPTPKKKKEVSKRFRAIIAVLLAVLLGLLCWSVYKRFSAADPAVAAEVTPTAEASESAQPIQNASAELEGSGEMFTRPCGHEANRVCDSNLDRLKETAAKMQGEGGELVITEEVARESMLQRAYEDPQVLAILATASGVWDGGYNDISRLATMEGEAYKATEEAREVYNDLKGAFKVAKFERGQASSSDYGSGWANGQFGRSEQPGIAGDDREATRVNFPNGNGFTQMDRCANLTWPASAAPASLPVVATDNVLYVVEEQTAPAPQGGGGGTPVVPSGDPTTNPPSGGNVKKNPAADPVVRDNAATGGGANSSTSRGAGVVQPRPADPPVTYEAPAAPRATVAPAPAPTSNQQGSNRISAGTPGGGPQSSTTVNDGGSNDKGGGGTQEGGAPAGSGSSDPGGGTLGSDEGVI